MHKALIGAAFIAALFSWTAQAQPVPTPASVSIACAQNSVLPALASGQFGWAQCDANGRLYTSPIGWTPIGTYITPIAVTNASAASLLPSGQSVTIYNTGANVAYVKFGQANTVTATTADDAIPAGGGCGFYVYPNTWIAALTTSSTTTLNISGGTGMAPGCWGGASSGGGAATNATIVSPLGTNSIAASVAVTPATSSVWSASQSGTWTVQPGNTANTTAWKVDGSAVTQPVSAASLPLPTGASTSAKQPVLGTAGAASADVLSVQGIASMTALKVDGSAVTQPISGTTTANQGTAAGSGPWITTPWIAGAVASATNGTYDNILQGNAVLSTTNPLPTSTFIQPLTSAQGGNLTPVVSLALEASNTLKAGAGNLYAAYATSTTGAAGYFICVNATSISAGAVTPLDFVAIPAGPSTASIVYSPGPAAKYSTGITCAVTVAATPFTFTSGGSVFAYHGLVN